MPNLSEKKDPFKCIIIGDSGTGKTGALSALVDLGLELFILDFDNGTDILSRIVKGDARKRVHVETLTDTGKLMGVGLNQKIAKLNPQAFPKSLALLQRWVDSASKEDFGPVTEWGANRVLVIDSLSFWGSSALDYVLAANGRGGGVQPWQSDWGEAMRMLEQALQIIYSADVKCNVVMTSHVEYITIEGQTKGLPMGLGQKLPPKIGRYFNFMLMTKTRGVGDLAKRIILTKPEANIELKCPIVEMARELPQATGLGEVYKAWVKGG